MKKQQMARDVWGLQGRNKILSRLGFPAPEPNKYSILYLTKEIFRLWSTFATMHITFISSLHSVSLFGSPGIRIVSGPGV
mmetsp:Transcript_757/g.1785  ORF Transcript_757/g.1785 Transcript_757/m.1785 type:complete len:80 (+) Transcript_757:495-734(+)